MPRGKSLLVCAVFSTAVLVCLCFYLVGGEGAEKKAPERDPLIKASLFEQWSIFPSFMPGMEWGEAPPEAPRMGSSPRFDGSVPTKCKESLFEEIVDSSHDQTIGIIYYPNGIDFIRAPMCYCGYSGNGELRWMVHAGDHGTTLSVGTFLDGTPDDGFFLLDTDTGDVILDPDISDYFKGRDLPPPLGRVELINGRTVGMISLRDKKSSSLVDQYLATKREIRDCLDWQRRL